MSFCIYDGMNTYGKLQGKKLDIRLVIRILLLSSIFGNESNKKSKSRICMMMSYPARIHPDSQSHHNHTSDHSCKLQVQAEWNILFSFSIHQRSLGISHLSSSTSVYPLIRLFMSSFIFRQIQSDLYPILVQSLYYY